MTKPYISVKIIDKNDRLVKKIASRKSKRVFNFIQREEFKNCVFKAGVNYGDGFNNKGKYVSKSYLIFALKAFLEKD